MLLCTCSSYTGICVARLDVYVYQSVRIVVCKSVRVLVAVQVLVTYVVFFLFERSEFLIATPPPKNLRVFDYVAAAVLAADADAAVLVATMTPPYVRQKRLLAG